MAIHPEAIVKLLTVNKNRKLLTVYNRVNCHVGVVLGRSLFADFNKAGAPDSHFFVYKDGSFEQYVDTIYRANADLDGNDASISIETEGGVVNPDSEPWTPEQVATIAKIYAWAVETHGIALKIATDSHLGASSHGLSWHRLGVDGNFPALPDMRAGRNQRGGGMYYTKHRGKLCPGGAKINQIPEIFALAQARVGVTPVASPQPAPTPTPVPPEAPSVPRINEDGFWGAEVTRRLQQILGTPVDGVVSSQFRPFAKGNPGLTWGWEWVTKPNGSQLIREIQKRVGADPDGVLGGDTVKAIQRYLGTPVDGVVSERSSMVMAIQRRLNEGKF